MSEQYPYQEQPQYDEYGRPVQPQAPYGEPAQQPQSQPSFPYEPYQGQQGHQDLSGRQGRHGQQGFHQDQQGFQQDQPAQQDPHQQYTQTWEGQTWDTQYQPTVAPTQQAAEPAPRRGRHAQPAESWQEGASVNAARPWEEGAAANTAQPWQGGEPRQDGGSAGGAYLPPQNGGGTTSVPLPPEVPMASGPAAEPVYEPAATPAAGAAGGPAYGSPTTVGNARVTDAQRARAEGRSPIIAPGMQPAALTAALGLLLAVAAPIGPYALAVPLVALQAVTAAGWFRLNGMWPARQGIALAFAGGLVADVALLALGREHAPAAILGTLGVWVLLTLVLQLRSHAEPDERMYGLMATVASAALAILAGGYLAAPPHAVSVGAAAVAVAALARALPLPSMAPVAVALLAAAGAGVAVGGLTGIGASGALLGLAAGACALIGLRVASYDYPSRFVHLTAGVALPLTAAVPVLYLIGRAVA
ncbi:hypothetical protein ACFYNY_30445 [Streptomyces sp. NPDC006530]|uniref:hypothetical protein n=1 Tax=Streptomyces sp. NPDC006530 TaxID=3364750 RepID=UPI0036A26A46